MTGFSVLLTAALLCAVAFHVALAQGQLELDGLRDAAAFEQDRYERLQVEAADAASPGELRRRAEELGLVEADQVFFVSLPPGSPSVAAPDGAEAAPSTTGNWDEVKPRLGEQP